jgi:hypothetical protein
VSSSDQSGGTVGCKGKREYNHIIDGESRLLMFTIWLCFTITLMKILMRSQLLATEGGLEELATVIQDAAVPRIICVNRVS